MGGWVLETVKMGIYVMFPVTTFYILNQPMIYDNWVKQEPKPKSLETLAFLEKLSERYRKEESEKAKGKIVLL